MLGESRVYIGGMGFGFCFIIGVSYVIESYILGIKLWFFFGVVFRVLFVC